ncbi:MAG: aminotransferase [Rhodobacterales bacterium]|nr:MAG: aminotransferase [Rhodobacterales bacterium]
MAMAGGRGYLAIPGPSVIPDEVLLAMHRASPNIYEGELIDMTAGILPDLRHVARTDHHAAIYIANGHGAWEAALSNVVAPGDRLLVLATGLFGHGWGDMARALGVRVEVLEFGRNSPVDPDRVRDVLAADRDGRIKAVLATHVDTSTSIRNDIAGIRAAMDAVGHKALLLADCIASLGCDRFEMDAWGVDVAVAASQKGLMVPAGLGFVFFNDRAAAVRQGLDRVSRYWDWVPRVAPDMFYEYFAGTAPTHHLYGLRVALDMIRDETLEGVWTRHARNARMVWAACTAWGQGGPLRMNVTDPASRSNAVTSLHIGVPHGSRLRAWVQDHAGVTLGIGLGMSDETDPGGQGYFRIGHMGHLNGQMVMAALGSIQAAFIALDIPHGPGALDAAATVLAQG